MPTEIETDRQRTNGAHTQEVNTCQNCGQLMPREMRFCRACGCRLGEGIEEYTETVRLPNAPQTARPRSTRTASTVPPPTSPAGFANWGAAMAHDIREQALRSANMAATVGLNHWKVARKCRRRVPKWMIWVFLPIIVFSIIGGPASFHRRSGNPAQTSYIGIETKTANGGAMIQDVTPPGSPADQAGLVGGDLITSLDGKPVSKESDVNNLLAQIPPGKTVDVVYVRDGETRTTRLTTISDQAMNDLREAFDNRPEGQGKFGIDNDDDAKVVPVPGMNINGVRLGDISKNLPADIAGVRKGDIVIQFGDTPIRTGKEFINRIHRAVPYSTVNLVVVRDGNRLEIPVKIGKR